MIGVDVQGRDGQILEHGPLRSFNNITHYLSNNNASKDSISGWISVLSNASNIAKTIFKVVSISSRLIALRTSFYHSSIPSPELFD
jgi:hypothetical protein|tara:strand:- start:220 stop:477 length:258 start_codon:yes stop_codon:yes gene_type:complete